MIATPSLATILVSCLAPFLLLAIGRRLPFPVSQHVAQATPWLSGRGAPVAMAALSMGLVAFVWGSLHEPGVIHDERAIVLQSRIFASGHWRGPSPSEPSFFEQMHVFMEPGVAAKYPPLHSAVLVPGVLVAEQGLMPVVLSGISAGLFFVLVRSALGEWVALASTCLFVTAQPNLFWRSSYFSETTTSMLWLVVGWCFLRWRVDQRPWRLALASAAAALMGLTRPLSAVLLVLPVAVPAALQIWRTRAWHQLVAPMVLFLATIGVVALWGDQTLGSGSTTPYSEYSRLNMPFDTFGFGLKPLAPVRRLPPDLEPVVDEARQIHALHTWRRLPVNMAEQVAALLQQTGGGWRWGLLVLCVAGIGFATPIEALMTWSIASMLIGYLAFAHSVTWTVYYLEILPAAFLAAVAQYWRLAMQAEPDPDRRRLHGDGLVAVSLALAVPLMWTDVSAAKELRQSVLEFHHLAEAKFAAIPDPRAVVFVRMGEAHNPALSLISAPASGSADRLWIVRDEGDRNRRLCQLALDRRPYIYDEATGALAPGGCAQ